MVEFISVSTGLHPLICKSIISVITRKTDMMVTAAGDLCAQFGVDESMGRGVARITLDKFNPDQAGKHNKVSGAIQISSKEILKKNFPGFPLEVVDQEFAVIAERDPQIFYDFLEQSGLPSALFKMAGAYLQEDEENLGKYMTEFCKDILDPAAFKQWVALRDVLQGNLKSDFHWLAKDLGFKYEFPLIDIIAFLRANPNLTRHCIKRTVEQIANSLETDFGIGIKEENIELTKKNLLALF